jgi:hypothetical protein
MYKSNYSILRLIVFYSYRQYRLWVPPSLLYILGAVSPGINLPGHETDHSLPSNADVKNDGAIHPLPLTSSWRNAEIIKSRDNFILPLMLLY